MGEQEDPLFSVHDVLDVLDVMNWVYRDKGVLLLSHVYDELLGLLSTATTVATPSEDFAVRKRRQLLPNRH